MNRYGFHGVGTAEGWKGGGKEPNKRLFQLEKPTCVCVAVRRETKCLQLFKVFDLEHPFGLLEKEKKAAKIREINIQALKLHCCPTLK